MEMRQLLEAKILDFSNGWPGLPRIVWAPWPIPRLLLHFRATKSRFIGLDYEVWINVYFVYLDRTRTWNELNKTSAASVNSLRYHQGELIVT